IRLIERSVRGVILDDRPPLSLIRVNSAPSHSANWLFGKSPRTTAVRSFKNVIAVRTAGPHESVAFTVEINGVKSCASSEVLAFRVRQTAHAPYQNTKRQVGRETAKSRHFASFYAKCLALWIANMLADPHSYIGRLYGVVHRRELQWQRD